MALSYLNEYGSAPLDLAESLMKILAEHQLTLKQRRQLTAILKEALDADLRGRRPKKRKSK